MTDTENLIRVNAELTRQRDAAEQQLKVTKAKLERFIEAIADLSIERMVLRGEVESLRSAHVTSGIHEHVVQIADDIMGLQPVTTDTIQLLDDLARYHHEQRIELTNYNAILHRDLDEAKTTIARMATVVMSAQRWAQSRGAPLEAMAAKGADEGLREVLEEYEEACSAAANAEEAVL